MNGGSAEDKIKRAWMAGIISGVITLIVTAVAMSGYSFMGFSAFNLLDVALIFGMTLGIYKKSRVCAVLMLIYFVGSKIYLWMDSGKLSGLPLALLFGYYFFQGMQGAFEYHSSNRAEELPSAQPAPSPVPKFKTREEYEQWKSVRFAQPQAGMAAPPAVSRVVPEKSSGLGWLAALLLVGGVVGVLAFTDLGGSLTGRITATPAPEWREFISTEGNFSISLPGTPSHETKQQHTVAGPIDMHLHTLSALHQTEYMVIYNDYPEIVLRADPEKVLDGGRDGAVANTKGKLISEQPLALEGAQAGREISIDVPGKGIIKIRVFLVNRRLYQLMVATPADHIDSEDTARYFTSFRLLTR